MGTSTIYIKHNDLGTSLSGMSKEELRKLSKIPHFDKERFYKGWKVSHELHNGNVYLLVFWKGRLMKLDEAIEELTNKYYDKYSGKTRNEYEWTLLRKYILNQIKYLDYEFKKRMKRKK